MLSITIIVVTRDIRPFLVNSTSILILSKTNNKFLRGFWMELGHPYTGQSPPLNVEGNGLQQQHEDHGFVQLPDVGTLIKQYNTLDLEV